MTTPLTTVIVGAGQAGAWMAITLRQLDPFGRIVLLGDEVHPPYERPPLSKGVLTGKSTLESAFIKPPAFYLDNRIELRLGVSVTAIDPAGQSVRMGDGEVLTYDRLVLATGARPRQLTLPGIDPGLVHVLRSADDVRRLRACLKPELRILAVGAGFIGLEFAAAAIEAGCLVSVIDSAPHAMGRAVDRLVAEVVQDAHRRRGVSFHFATQISAIVDTANGRLVTLSSGVTLTADLIIAGIGAIPNVELAAEAGLEVNDGIVVDSFGRSSDPAIYAVGDVTRHFNALVGRSLRLESWQNAQNQAICVARALMGGDEPYNEIPWFWTDQYDLNVQIVGAPSRWDRIVWRGNPGDEKCTAIYLDGDKIVAGNTINNARDIRFLKQLIAGGRSIDIGLLEAGTISLADLAKA